MSNKQPIICPPENPSLVSSNKSITQNGETNAVIQHADIVNINLQPNSELNYQCMFGDKKISANDAALLAVFKKDYKGILKYCICTDPTAEPFDIRCIDLIEEKYNERWQFDCREFDSEEIRKIAYHTLSNLNEYLHYLSEEYMRPLLSHPGFLIFKNQSAKEGEKLREGLRPNSFRIRKELRDRYLELWPEKEPEFKQSTEAPQSCNGE